MAEVSGNPRGESVGSRPGRVRPWYGLVALPPAALERRLRHLQEQLGVSGAEAEPHITLKMPFQVQTSLGEVVGRIARVAEGTRPISVTIAGIGGFPGPYMNAVYATVEPNPRLMALHNALVQTLCGTAENVHPYTADIELHSYVPHITIASDLSDEEFSRLMERVQGRELHEGFQLSEFKLMRRDALGRWRGVRSFRLGRRGRGDAPRA